MKRTLPLALAALVAMAACSDDVTAPEAPASSPEATSPVGSPMTLGAIDLELVVTIGNDPNNEYGPSGQQTSGLAPSFDPAIPNTHPEGAPLSRTFTVATCGSGCSGKVDFGDGTGPRNMNFSSSLAFDPDGNPYTVEKGSFSHTWTAPGSYKVVVAVENSMGGSNIIWNTVEVTSTNQAPSAFSPLSSTVEAGQPWSQAFTFADPDNAQWAVSYTNPVTQQGTGFVTTDRGFSLGPWVFSTSGTYQIPITVDDSEASTVFTHTVTVTAPAEPTAVNLTAPTAVAGYPVAVQIQGSPEPWSGSLAWGDGSETALTAGGNRTVSHTYATPGSYEAVATLTGAGALEGSVSTTIHVEAALKVAAPTKPVLQGDPVTVKAVLNGGVSFSGLTVDWGDGSRRETFLDPSGTVALKHRYGAHGTQRVTVIAVASTGENWVTQTTVSVQNVAPALTALSVSPSRISVGGTTTVSGAFTDPGDDSWTVTVAWGDASAPQEIQGQPGVPFSLDHTFSRAGRYAVKVTVSDGSSATSEKLDVTVVNRPPVARIEAPSQVMCTEAGAIPVSGAGSSDPDGRIVAWRWSVNRTQVATGETATLSLPLGSHAVTLTVQDDGGARASAYTTIQVLDGAAPVVTMDQNVSEIFPPDSQMVAVATVRAEDGCDPAPALDISVTANEALGSGDWRLVDQGDGTWVVEVLAARAGASRDGRIYTITAVATDASGNRSAAETATVTVKHDNRNADRGRNGNGGRGRGRGL